MGDSVKISRGLWEKLAPHVEQGADIDSLLEDLLFEVPDEALDRLVGLKDPVAVEVGSRTHMLLTSMADDFGLSPVGLTLLLAEVFDKMMLVRSKFEAYVTRNS